MMLLIERDDSNVVVSDEDGGCVTNVSEHMVLLRLPSLRELRGCWHDFRHIMADRLFRLLSTPYGELCSTFGSLDLNIGNIAAREALLYGLLTKGDEEAPKYHLLRAAAVASSMADLGKAPQFTPHGKPRKRLLRGDGPMAKVVATLGHEDQKRLLRNLVDRYDVDEYLRLNQTSRAGFAETAEKLANADDPTHVLSYLMACLNRHISEVTSMGSESSAGKGSGYIFAPIWFAQYLVSRGIWLFPLNYISHVRRAYPRKLLPLLGWMNLPPDCWDIANLTFSLERDRRTSTLKMCANVLVACALASSMWRERRFCSQPLVELKSWIAKTGNNAVQAGSTNRTYDLLLRCFKIDASTRREATLFYQRKRLHAPINTEFRWVFQPTPRNTRRAANILGRPVVDVPAHVKNWAAEFTSILHLFDVKRVETIINCFNAWLIFLIWRGEADAPDSFRSINRSVHINDLGEDSPTFVNFLRLNFEENIKQRAISKMAQAWELVAARDAFAGEQTNPFSVYIDPPAKGRKRKYRTSRRAMEFRAFFLLLDENRKNEFEFARSNPRTIKPMVNPETGQIQDVFWPLEAVAIDAIMSMGARNFDARWMDSGEGDEYLVDVENVREERNLLPSAMAGRRSGFLRVAKVHFPTPQNIIVGYLNSNKTGDLNEIAYVDLELARSVRWLMLQQAIFNPMMAPVLLEDSRHLSIHVDQDKYERVFPLLREPTSGMHAAISPERIRSYWLKLCKHAQPLVDSLLGYHYPLTKGDLARFDVHALRVTVVTFLLEKGVPLSAVRQYVRHASFLMTLYYDSFRLDPVHSQIAQAFQRHEALVDAAADGDPSALLTIAGESFEQPDASNRDAIMHLKGVASGEATAALDFFRSGICVGGDCSKGLMVGGRPQPVWRPRACSGCRFRSTGPRFLQGIIERANGLALEIKRSFERTDDLNVQIANREAGGDPQHKLRAAVDAEDALRTQLYGEWFAECRTALRAEAALRDGRSQLMPVSANPDTPVPLSPVDPSLLRLEIEEVDELELVHWLSKTHTAIGCSESSIQADVTNTYLGQLKRMFAINKIGDLMYRAETANGPMPLLDLADSAIKHFGPSMVRDFIKQADELSPAPLLADFLAAKATSTIGG